MSPAARGFSLASLEPNERETMLSTCQRLNGEDLALCLRIVGDQRVIANYKRSCLEAMTLLLHGSTWATVKSLPSSLTCREGLQRAGYNVSEILRRLGGAP